MSAIQQLMMSYASGSWTPPDAGALRGWYVSDNPSNTLSSGFLITLADKSGNSNTFGALLGAGANQATLVSSGLNSRTIWRSDSVSKLGLFVGADVTVAQNAAGFTLAIVSKLNPAIGTTDASVFRANINGTASARAMIGRNNGISAFAGSCYAGGRRLDADSFQGAQDAIDHSTNWIIQVAVFDFVARTCVISVDGTLTTNSSFQTTGNTSNTTSVSTAIGHNGTGVAPAYGDYAEAAMYKSALGTTDRQKLEGYLAWQWGLAGNLPGGHPYKSVAP